MKAAMVGTKSRPLQVSFANSAAISGDDSGFGGGAKHSGGGPLGGTAASAGRISFAHLVLSPRRDAGGTIVGVIATRSKRRQSVVAEAAANVFRKFSDREITPMTHTALAAAGAVDGRD